MKNSRYNELKIFKGAGWLIAFVILITCALVVFSLSNNFIAAISSALPIGIFTGISLEQKFQRKKRTKRI